MGYGLFILDIIWTLLDLLETYHQLKKALCRLLKKAAGWDLKLLPSLEETAITLNLDTI